MFTADAKGPPTNHGRNRDRYREGEQDAHGVESNISLLPTLTDLGRWIQIDRQAADSDVTIDRAKKEMGIESDKKGFGDDGEWRWSLPEGA